MSISTKITVDNSELTKGLKNAESQAQKSMKSISDSARAAGQAMKGDFKGISDILSKLGPVGVGVATAITAVAGAVTLAVKGINSLAGSINNTAKQAKSVDMTANQYLALEHACSRAGIEMGEVTQVVEKIDYAMTHAIDGEKKYRDIFYSLGLSWRDMTKLSPEKQLMNVTDALRRMKNEGQNIPREVYDLFGRRGMRTLNKILAESDFSKFIAEAGALGYGINDANVKAAEMLADAYGDAGQKLKSLVSNLKETKALMEGLKDITQFFTGKLGANGFVSEEYRDRFIGIGNVAKDLFTNNQELFTINELREILAQYKESTMQRNPMMNEADLRAGIKTAVANMSAEEVRVAVKNIIKDLDWQNMPYFLRNAIYRPVARIDKRFNFKDLNTWVQPEDTRKAPDLQLAQAQDKADYIKQALEAELKAQESVLSKLELKKDVEVAIYEIEKKHNRELSESVKQELKLLDIDRKRNAAQIERDKFSQKSQAASVSSISDLLAMNRRREDGVAGLHGLFKKCIS